jgi:folate-binding protein YgfZ
VSAVVSRPPRDVVVVTGADARSFLQSLVSQDLDPLADGDGVRSLLLTPQGKLDVEFGLVLVGDEVWLVCEGGLGEQLASSLNRFKIRVDVQIELRPDLGVLLVLDGGEVEEPAVPSPWPGARGVEVVGPAEKVDALEAEHVGSGAERWPGEEYERRRIAAGVPRQGFELDGKTIPQEAFLEPSVSFDKGCFLGQELVCRIDTRGHVNRYLRRLTTIEGEAPPGGAEIVAGEKVVGAVTSAADGTALGYVRREVEPPADVTLRWDGGEARARVEA